jgi:hypothetical protein
MGGEAPMTIGKQYGIELLRDLAGCDPDTFTRVSLDKFFTEVLPCHAA